MELDEFAKVHKCDFFTDLNRNIVEGISKRTVRALIPYHFRVRCWGELMQYCKSVQFVQTELSHNGKRKVQGFLIVEMSKEKVKETLVVTPPILSASYSPLVAIKSQTTKNRNLGVYENKASTCYSSSGIQEVVTPDEIYSPLHRVYNFDFDPCPVNPDFDGLQVEWGKSNFVNPPFRVYLLWVIKAIEECKKGKGSVLLIPSNTRSVAYCKLVMCGYVEYFCFLYSHKWRKHHYSDMCVIRLDPSHTDKAKVFVHDFMKPENNTFVTYLLNV